MKKKRTNVFIVLLVLLLSISFSFTASAKSNIPSVFKSKYPKETVHVLKKVDLDKDRKFETVILSKQGNLFLIKGKTVKKVATQIISEEDLSSPKLLIFNPAKGEYQIITTYSYYPGNTQAAVYRMQKGKLVRILNVMGDVDIRISKTKVYQDWKKYRNADVGGWDPVTAVYTWNNKKQKFVASGIRP